jgi:hypothetical protein
MENKIIIFRCDRNVCKLNMCIVQLSISKQKVLHLVTEYVIDVTVLP